MEYNSHMCCILVTFFAVSHFGFQKVLAVPKAPKPPIQVLVPDVVEINKKAVLECQVASDINNIQRVTWKRRQNSPTPSTNATLTPDVILVTNDYMGEETSRNITYWALKEKLKLTEENGLEISAVSVQDEGVYCCQILMKNSDTFEHCGTVNVTVFPHLTFQGTNCKAEEVYCKTYAHLGKNLTCIARYRPNVPVKLTWKVSKLHVPLNPTTTMYRNVTEDGVLYFEAYSDVKFSKTGSYRYSCTAKTDRCGTGGCVVTDVVLVSRKHHLSLWWLVVPLLLMFVVLFILRWRKQSSRQTERFPQPVSVYHPVTTDTTFVDPEKEKL